MGVPGSSLGSYTIQQIQEISGQELSEVLEKLRIHLRKESQRTPFEQLPTLHARKDSTMSDKDGLKAHLQALEAVIDKLETEYGKGLVDLGRYLQLKTEHETNKAKLEQAIKTLGQPLAGEAGSSAVQDSDETLILKALYQIHKNTPGKSANSERIRKQIGLNPAQMNNAILALEEDDFITSRFVGGKALLKITADGVALIES
jgi:DNA-binding MarR family transcriptional regulator